MLQESTDPTVEPPPDARYLAEENNVVEEETLARVQSAAGELRPEETELSAPEEELPEEATEPGDSAEEEIAQEDDVDGDDSRRPTPDESRAEPLPEDDPSITRRLTESGGQAESAGSETRPTTEQRADDSGQRAEGGGEPEPTVTEILVSDGVGSYRVRITEPRPRGSGAGDGGGARREGHGAGDRGRGHGRGRVALREGDGHDHDDHAPRIGLGWTDFERIYGEEELERDRLARLERRRSRTRGRAEERERLWQRFRSAIENYIEGVRPGNQTALNARADPFAAYVARMHDRIHPEFAVRYLGGLPLDVGGGLGDMTLNATLEIGVRADGSIERIGVIRTSGNTLFDFGAFAAVMRAQPFAATPSAIRSGDGLVWVHWRFDRGQRQCGTFQANMFILDNGPAEAEEAGSVSDLPEGSPEAEHESAGDVSAPGDGLSVTM